jgi:anthranilate synthase component 1
MPATCVVRTLDVFPELSTLHRMQPQRYPFLLESVAHGPAQARYDILFAFPGATLSLISGNHLSRAGRRSAGDFLSALDDDWRHAAQGRAAAPADDAPPFTGGWFLYLGYELATSIEPSVPQMPVDHDLPVALATRIPAAIIRDHALRRTVLVCEHTDAAVQMPQMEKDISAVTTDDYPVAAVHVRMQEEAPQHYLDGITRILEYIRAGDVFQVNLSRAWSGTLESDIAPVEIYRRLRDTNPSPFSGLMTLGNNRAVISSSPERLVEVRGGKLRTRPIAGTSPRSTNSEQDRAWSGDLLRHPKERAEHVMLVDLERNDIGRVCVPGTVKVTELMTLESYRHVHHIVSGIEGELRAGVTPAQVIRAVFPGGTITGCPKVRTMQIIAELEQTGRGAYTGSMGYLNHDGSMDLNILIRTLVQNGRHIGLRAGAGIVADSDPERELDETRAKARGMLAALAGVPG